jgi:hypothetical protein
VCGVKILDKDGGVIRHDARNCGSNKPRDTFSKGGDKGQSNKGKKDKDKKKSDSSKPSLKNPGQYSNSDLKAFAVESYEILKKRGAADTPFDALVVSNKKKSKLMTKEEWDAESWGEGG